MPVLTEDHTIVASLTREYIIIPVERQYIKTLTLYDLYQTASLRQIWAQIGIMSGGHTTQNIIATLASGYLNRISPIAWSGNLPVDPDMSLFAEIYGPVGQQLRLCAILYKIVTTPEGLFHVDS